MEATPAGVNAPGTTNRPWLLRMKTRLFDHIDLRVKDMAAAKKFYVQLLASSRLYIDSSGDEWAIWQAAGAGQSHSLDLRRSRRIGQRQTDCVLGGEPG